MSELRTLINQSGMSLKDFAYAIGVRETRIRRMLNGDAPTPAGVLSDAYQLLADIDYVEALLEAEPRLKDMSYKIFKMLLTQESESIY